MKTILLFFKTGRLLVITCLFILVNSTIYTQHLEVEGTIQIKEKNPELELFRTQSPLGPAGVKTRLHFNGSSILESLNGPLRLNATPSGSQVSQTRLFIDDDTGNVGIGILDPSTPLETISPFRISTTSVPQLELFQNQEDRVACVLRAVLDDVQLISRNGNLLFGNGIGGTTRMIIEEAGQVGIGTLSPEAKLEIEHNAVAGNPQLQLTETGTDGARIYFKNTADLSPYSYVISDPANANPNFAIGYNDGTGSEAVVDIDFLTKKLEVLGFLQINNAGSGSYNIRVGEDGDLDFQGNGTVHMTIADTNGDVGIGTSTIPGYKLAVDGNIITEEVRVELSGDWPDYVFEDEYNLMSITDLEKSIQKNGRLPGIPSATEVEANGIQLGDMQKRMMEKIEELSLYIIELSKKYEKVEAQLTQQKNQ